MVSYLFGNANKLIIQVLHNVSGLNGQSGELVVGTSTVRTGTVSTGSLIGLYYKDITVTFSSPMPDADYVVELSISDVSTTSVITGLIVMEDSKTTTGFKIRVFIREKEASLTEQYWNVTYKAFKLYTTEDITQAQSDIIGLQTQNKTTHPTCTVNSTNASGTINLSRYGNIVQVTISNLVMKASASSGNLMVATGLPKTNRATDRCFLINTAKMNAKADTSQPYIAAYGVTTGWVNQNGQLYVDINACLVGDVLWGSFTYICED